MTNTPTRLEFSLLKGTVDEIVRTVSELGNRIDMLVEALDQIPVRSPKMASLIADLDPVANVPVAEARRPPAPSWRTHAPDGPIVVRKAWRPPNDGKTYTHAEQAAWRVRYDQAVWMLNEPERSAQPLFADYLSAQGVEPNYALTSQQSAQVDEANSWRGG